MTKSVLAILVALVLVSGVALADRTSSATAPVSVDVVANIGIAYTGATVVMSPVQTGAVEGAVIFAVEANVQEIDLQVAVSNLYKDNAPASVSQIPVDITKKVGVRPVIGQELPVGEDNALPLLPSSVAVGPFPIGFQTVQGHFGSGTAGHFSQSVTVTPSWTQTDPELPVGTYGGIVILTGVINPA
jgi:hypothetical protein